jgi:hypothetical protein
LDIAAVEVEEEGEKVDRKGMKLLICVKDADILGAAED